MFLICSFVYRKNATFYRFSRPICNDHHSYAGRLDYDRHEQAIALIHQRLNLQRQQMTSIPFPPKSELRTHTDSKKSNGVKTGSQAERKKRFLLCDRNEPDIRVRSELGECKTTAISPHPNIDTGIFPRIYPIIHPQFRLRPSKGVFATQAQ